MFSLVGAPPSNHAEQLYHYHRYQDTLNFDGLSFPLAIREIEPDHQH